MISRKSGTFSLIEEFKNSGLVMILHCLNSFQHNNNIFSLLNVLLRQKPQDKCFIIVFHNLADCQSCM